MARVTGLGALGKRFKKMRGPAAKKLVEAALFHGGELIQVEAQRSISAGSVSGKGHVPSKPGEPPNYDTGTLANMIVTARAGPMTVEVSSNAPYSVYLEREYGTSKMKARPFMHPALDKMIPTVRRLVAVAVRASKKV